MIRNRYIKRGDSSMVKEIRKDKGCSMKPRDARNAHATELEIYSFVYALREYPDFIEQC
jgi:hypothetical protein